jgi:outer membrane protein OmpA-like peptidoglycan-associated protein
MKLSLPNAKYAVAILISLLAGSFFIATEAHAQTVVASRGTLAITYPEGKGTSIDMVGSALIPRARGKAEVKRQSGRTRIKLEIRNLEHPQSLGNYYTTYVLWAIAPEGQADSLGELQPVGPAERNIEVTTPYQAFGLIVTAEPHGLVRLPAPAIVAENVLREHTKGDISASRIEYRGDPGLLYITSGSASPALSPDYHTPLLVLGARRAVDIARRGGASEHADQELRDAEVKLAALEQIWPRHRTHERQFSGQAREIMRIAEQARALATERIEQARLAAERRAADRTILQAQSEADRATEAAARANEAAARAKQETADFRDALTRSESELAQARQRAEQAQSDADRAKANEEVSRIQAERARLEAEQAKRERDSAQQRLFISLSEILETRREARGLIVNLSDVLFDFNQATLKPGAKEKLSKLAGILLAFPGQYQMEIEGHTDAIGSDQYNLKLSEARATSVRDYIAQAGIPSTRIIAVRGFGKVRPVATNDTAEGRQMNRRVEIIIADHELGQQ